MKVVVVFASKENAFQQPVTLGDIGSLTIYIEFLSHKARNALESFDYSQHDLFFCPVELWNRNDLDLYSVYLLDPILDILSLPTNSYYLDENLKEIELHRCEDDGSILNSFKLMYLFDELEASLQKTIENASFDSNIQYSDGLSFEQSLLDFSDDKLVPFSFSIFKHYQKELNNLCIDEGILYRFLYLIKSLYHSNEYHNFYHAIDVLQCTHHIISDPILRASLRDIDIFAVLISAVCHDVGHLGVNNPFLVAYNSDLALLYNDSSPLENYHAFLANFIMEKIGSCDFRCKWDRSLKKEFRKLLIGSILATDMAHHNKYLSLFQSKELLYSDKCLFLGMILKAADLSNVVRPFSSSERWSHCLKTEFYLQGRMEKKLGYRPAFKYLDESKDVFRESQLYFLVTFALPLFEILISYTPSLGYMLKNLQSNIDEWRGKTNK